MHKAKDKFIKNIAILSVFALVSACSTKATLEYGQGALPEEMPSETQMKALMGDDYNQNSTTDNSFEDENLNTAYDKSHSNDDQRYNNDSFTAWTISNIFNHRFADADSNVNYADFTSEGASVEKILNAIHNGNYGSDVAEADKKNITTILKEKEFSVPTYITLFGNAASNANVDVTHYSRSSVTGDITEGGKDAADTSTVDNQSFYDYTGNILTTYSSANSIYATPMGMNEITAYSTKDSNDYTTLPTDTTEENDLNYNQNILKIGQAGYETFGKTLAYFNNTNNGLNDHSKAVALNIDSINDYKNVSGMLYNQANAGNSDQYYGSYDYIGENGLAPLESMDKSKGAKMFLFINDAIYKDTDDKYKNNNSFSFRAQAEETIQSAALILNPTIHDNRVVSTNASEPELNKTLALNQLSRENLVEKGYKLDNGYDCDGGNASATNCLYYIINNGSTPNDVYNLTDDTENIGKNGKKGLLNQSISQYDDYFYGLSVSSALIASMYLNDTSGDRDTVYNEFDNSNRIVMSYVKGMGIHGYLGIDSGVTGFVTDVSDTQQLVSGTANSTNLTEKQRAQIAHAKVTADVNNVYNFTKQIFNNNDAVNTSDSSYLDKAIELMKFTAKNQYSGDNHELKKSGNYMQVDYNINTNLTTAIKNGTTAGYDLNGASILDCAKGQTDCDASKNYLTWRYKEDSENDLVPDLVYDESSSGSVIQAYLKESGLASGAKNINSGNFTLSVNEEANMTYTNTYKHLREYSRLMSYDGKDVIMDDDFGTLTITGTDGNETNVAVKIINGIPMFKNKYGAYVALNYAYETSYAVGSNAKKTNQLRDKDETIAALQACYDDFNSNHCRIMETAGNAYGEVQKDEIINYVNSVASSTGETAYFTYCGDLALDEGNFCKTLGNILPTDRSAAKISDTYLVTPSNFGHNFNNSIRGLYDSIDVNLLGDAMQMDISSYISQKNDARSFDIRGKIEVNEFNNFTSSYKQANLAKGEVESSLNLAGFSMRDDNPHNFIVKDEANFSFNRGNYLASDMTVYDKSNLSDDVSSDFSEYNFSMFGATLSMSDSIATNITNKSDHEDQTTNLRLHRPQLGMIERYGDIKNYQIAYDVNSNISLSGGFINAAASHVANDSTDTLGLYGLRTTETSSTVSSFGINTKFKGFDIMLNSSIMKEEGSILGMVGSGNFSTGGATTAFANITVKKFFGDSGVSAFVNYSYGELLESETNGLFLLAIEDVKLNGYAFGLDAKNVFGGNDISLMLKQDMVNTAGSAYLGNGNTIERHDLAVSSDEVARQIELSIFNHNGMKFTNRLSGKNGINSKVRRGLTFIHVTNPNNNKLLDDEYGIALDLTVSF